MLLIAICTTGHWLTGRLVQELNVYTVALSQLFLTVNTALNSSPAVCILDVIDRFLYNRAVVDVRSTGAGIECLHCSFVSVVPYGTL